MKSDSNLLQQSGLVGAAVDCSHDIWSETIVRAFTNLCLFSTFDFRDTRWLSHRLHIVSLELGPLRTNEVLMATFKAG